MAPRVSHAAELVRGATQRTSALCVDARTSAFSVFIGEESDLDLAKSNKEPEKKEKLTDCVGQKIAIRDDSTFRKAWSILLVVMLLYVAIVLPYTLAFLEFRVPREEPPTLFRKTVMWIVDIFFWIDLVLNFLMTYRDAHGREVTRLSRIACRYTSGPFIVDLISCMPAQVFEYILMKISDKAAGTSTNKAARISRLHRLPRLAKLVRVLRLAKIFTFVRDNEFYRKLNENKGFREVSFLISFMIVAHVVGCGWSLVASLHGERGLKDTWIWRRHDSGAAFFEEPAKVHWLHSMYFVVTVFTTVGFGDMSGFTQAEMVYCIFTMLVGGIVNSIIMGQVINIMQSSDKISMQRDEQAELVKSFVEHTQLSHSTAKKFFDFVAKTKSIHHGYDREQIKKLMTRHVFPRELEGELPTALFRGELMRNTMLRLAGIKGMPVRLPLYVALAVHQRFMVTHDIVYCAGDQPASVHLVLSGVFAYVAMSSLGMRSNGNLGGLDGLVSSSNRYKAPALEVRPGEHYPYKLFCRRNYFGDTELFIEKKARMSTVRCESDGSMLVFDKHDLTALADEFPNQIGILIKEALRRERARVDSLAALRHQYKSFFDLAAFNMQFWWRKRQKEFTGRKPIGCIAEVHFLASKSRDNLQEELEDSVLKLRSISAPAIANMQSSSVENVDLSRFATKEDVNLVRQEVSQMRKEISDLTSTIAMAVGLNRVQALPIGSRQCL